jgi:pimeloyl-ACP methyl ester carboxylesterase
MKRVLLHGVADTYRVWDKVRACMPHLDTEALALPGFGVDLEPNFPSDKEAYVEWIIERLERMNTPIDLVGHDWGGMLALRVASLRHDLVRTVVSGNGPISANYVWHALARIWQQPGEGEAWMRDLDREKFTGLLQTLGVDEADAASTASHVDERMKASILKLYRSAIHVGAEWAPGLRKIRCPALIYWGKQDAECPLRFAFEMSGSIPGSRVREVDCGHWVPLQAPEALANLLEEHWRHAESFATAG